MELKTTKRDMIEQIFFDTDCISSFLWVKRTDILLNLYGKRIILPEQVLDELSNPGVSHLSTKANQLLSQNQIGTAEILVGTEEFDLYYMLTRNPQYGQKRIGKGEASAIALAKVRKGILASNNLKDIRYYIQQFNLKNLTTPMILRDALLRKLIDETEGNAIWRQMINKRRKLPAATFTDYIASLK
jgi:predicted nucleic acid-binding protein